MNHLTQAGSSNVPQYLPLKRKRGRPRKDPSLKRVGVSRATPAYGVRENRYHQPDTIDFSNGGMVGQAVTGVIDAAFDAGYLLTVRIGNSNTSFRGVVFKPGNFVPVTAMNDVAPHVQMIKRSDVPFPLENQSQGSNGPRERTEINGAYHVNQGSRLSAQSSALVTSKGKHALPASSFAHLNGRGTVVPVVLQPTNAFNGSPSSDSSDKDVVAAEPLAMLLPFGSPPSNQFVTAKTDQLTSRAQNVELVQPGSFHNANDSCSDGSRVIEGRGEAENLTQSQVPVPVESVTVIQAASEPSYTHDDRRGYSAAISHNIPSPHATQHMKNDGSGHMTELLQENFQPGVASNVESQQSEDSRLESNNQAAW